MTPDDTQARTAAHAPKDEDEEARREMDRLANADELPSDPTDWPAGKAKFLTLGGGDDGDRYGEGATAKLGPAEVVHHAGGSVSVGGELVDDPEEFKGEPIPGGPTDPNSPALAGERKRTEDSEDAGDDDDQ